MSRLHICVLDIKGTHGYILMGNIPSNHVRIWGELTNIKNDDTRLAMVEKILIAPEYVNSLKQTGLYSGVLTWASVIKRGQRADWPVYASPASGLNGAARIVPNSANRLPSPAYNPPPSPGGGGNNAIINAPPARKAIDYLHESYELLGLSDDVPLTVDALKAAYKKRALAVHPDKKGGNAELFDAMTKSYLFLQEVITKLVPKNAMTANGDKAKVTMEAAVKYRNDPSVPVYDDGLNVNNPGIAVVVRDMNTPEYAPPPISPKAQNTGGSGGSGGMPPGPPNTLNPKNLDMNVFNQIFEQNRMADAEKDDGYGDWLKSAENSGKAPSKMGGKFSVDVFNKLFEDEAKTLGQNKQNGLTNYNNPDALMLSPTAVVLGGDKPSEYTAPAGAGLQFTDLKAAYSTRTTFSQEVSHVPIATKTFSQAKAEREKDPGPASVEEMRQIEAMKHRVELEERARQMRAAAFDTNAGSYHDRLKQRLYITEKPLQ